MGIDNAFCTNNVANIMNSKDPTVNLKLFKKNIKAILNTMIYDYSLYDTLTNAQERGGEMYDTCVEEIERVFHNNGYRVEVGKCDYFVNFIQGSAILGIYASTDGKTFNIYCCFSHYPMNKDGEADFSKEPYIIQDYKITKQKNGEFSFTKTQF